MRQILVERAGARGRLKRGGDRQRITLSDSVAAVDEAPADVEVLDDALSRLAAFDPELARLVELRFAGGLSIEETGEVLGIAPAIVKRHWTTTRAWLCRTLAG